MRSIERLLTVKEVAAIFGVAASSVWRWAKQGVVPEPIKFGGRTKWVEAEILEAIKQAKANRGGGGLKKHAQVGVSGKRRVQREDTDKKKTVRVRL